MDEDAVGRFCKGALHVSRIVSDLTELRKSCAHRRAFAKPEHNPTVERSAPRWEDRAMRRFIARREFLTATLSLTLSPVVHAASVPSEKRYGPGAERSRDIDRTDRSVQRPASSLSILAKVQAAYFEMINERGGSTVVKYGSSRWTTDIAPLKPSNRHGVSSAGQRAVHVQPIGTPTNAAVQSYLNANRVPTLFVQAGASRFSENPTNWPWTIGGMVAYRSEGAVYGKFFWPTNRTPRSAESSTRTTISGVTCGWFARWPRRPAQQNDRCGSRVQFDRRYGRLPNRAAEGLGCGCALLFCDAKICGAGHSQDVRVGLASYALYDNKAAHRSRQPSFCRYFEASIGIYTASDHEHLDNPDASPELKEWYAFMKARVPEGHPEQSVEAHAYVTARLLERVLRQCGDDLTRDNVMKQATNLRDVAMPLKLPSVRANTSPTDYTLIKGLQIQQYDGVQWVPVGVPYSL